MRWNALLGVVAAVALAAPAAATGDCCVYWSTGVNDTIGRAPLTGYYPRPYWIDTASDGAFGLAADEEHLYWGGDGMVGRVGLDGSGATPAFISGLADSRQSSIAVDAGHVYWVEPAAGTIGRANLDGSGVDESFIAAGFPTGVAADASHVYWTDGIGGTIGRANLDGSGVDADFITGANLPGEVAVDASHIYWANFGADSIGRAKLDGSGAVQAFIAAVNDPLELAIDAGHVYWTDLSSGQIGRANLDGSGIDPGFVDAGAFGVAVGPPGAIGDVRAKRFRRQDRQAVLVRLQVSARQWLTATARGRLTLAGKPSTFGLKQLRPKILFVRGGSKGVLRLEPRRSRDARTIAEALAHGATATAEVTVKLADNLGNHEFEKLRIRVAGHSAIRDRAALAVAIVG